MIFLDDEGYLDSESIPMVLTKIKDMYLLPPHKDKLSRLGGILFEVISISHLGRLYNDSTLRLTC